jgi:hypothetical protein
MAVIHNPTILQLVLLNDTGDSYHRMRWPASQLAEQDPTLRVINLDARAEERFIWAQHADLLVLFQAGDEDLFPLLLERSKKGLKTIVEYNDNFYAPPPNSPVNEAWSSPLLWQTYERFINLADQLIVTGPGLKELFSPLAASKTIILENHLPYQPPAFESKNFTTDNHFHFGWGGSLGHITDLIAFSPLIQNILSTNQQIHFHAMGNAAIPELLQLPPDQFHFAAWDSIQRYLEFWDDVELGIILCCDSPYNDCRSDIKAVEIASRGALPLLPRSTPYKTLIDTELFPAYSSGEELQHLILYFSTHKEELRDKAKRCYDYVLANRLGIKHFERLELYKSHLPTKNKSSTDFSWPVPAGYHEILGTQEKRTRSSRYLEEVQYLINQKKVIDAETIICEGYRSNPFNCTLGFAMQLLTNRSGGGCANIDLSSVFPRDMRMQLLTRSAKKLEEFWLQFLTELKLLPISAQQFFKKDILTAYAKDMQSTPDLAKFGNDLLTIYQDALTFLKS